jgi:hypothetical protein
MEGFPRSIKIKYIYIMNSFSQNKPPYIFDLGGALGAPRSVGLRQQQSLGDDYYHNHPKNFTTSVATSNWL